MIFGVKYPEEIHIKNIKNSPTSRE